MRRRRAHLTADATDMKFVLLHDAKGDDGVKAFFVDVWELYIKVTKADSSATVG